jgi:hypothetical protein
MSVGSQSIVRKRDYYDLVRRTSLLVTCIVKLSSARLLSICSELIVHKNDLCLEAWLAWMRLIHSMF